MQIRSLAYATGHVSYTQQELFAALGYAPETKAEKIFQRSTIDRRQLVLEPQELARLSSAEFQNTTARTRGFELACKAACEALLHSDVADIDCVIAATSSGMTMPSVSARLLAKLGLRERVVKYDLVGMGCMVAPTALGLARDYLTAHPGHRVLVTCMELGSLDLLPAEPDEGLERTVINSLFGDAAVAYVVDDSVLAGCCWPQVVDTLALQKPGSLHAAGLRVYPAGNRKLELSQDIPEFARELAEQAVTYFQLGLEAEDRSIAHWALHPGGRAVIDGIQDQFDLPDGVVAPSRKSLADHGNTGSVGCSISLANLVAAHKPEPGDYGVLMALGPGLSLGALLLRWP